MVVLEVSQIVEFVLTKSRHDFRVRDDVHDALSLGFELSKCGQDSLFLRSEL